MDLATRRARYAKLSTALAHLDDEALLRLLPRSRRQGSTQTVEVAGERVFVKLVPVTDLERDRPYSTRNHYGLPTYYQYGVGSAGFGAWREIVAHVTTTNWVLEDAIVTFPLMYHFRVVRRPRMADPFTVNGVDAYVRDWNQSRSIGRYVVERSSGSHAALIFLELLPHSVWDWLAARPEETDRLTRELCDTVSFLRGHGIVHFDAHFNNAMTDGERVYLTDFGLTVDPRFDLTAREHAFLERHSHYDYGEVLFSIGPQLAFWYGSRPEPEQLAIRRRLGVDDPDLVPSALLRDVERLEGMAPPALLDAAVRYRGVAVFMEDFFGRISANRRKNTPFDDEALRRLLVDAGVVSA